MKKREELAGYPFGRVKQYQLERKHVVPISWTKLNENTALPRGIHTLRRSQILLELFIYSNSNSKDPWNKFPFSKTTNSSN